MSSTDQALAPPCIVLKHGFLDVQAADTGARFRHRRSVSVPASYVLGGEGAQDVKGAAAAQLDRLSTIMRGEFRPSHVVEWSYDGDGGADAAAADGTHGAVTMTRTNTAPSTSAGPSIDEGLKENDGSYSGLLPRPRHAGPRSAARGGCAAVTGDVSKEEQTLGQADSSSMVGADVGQCALKKKSRPSKSKREQVQKALALIEAQVKAQPDLFMSGVLELPATINEVPSRRARVMTRLTQLAKAAYLNGVGPASR